MTVFHGGAGYYDLLYADKPHNTEVQHLIDIAQTAGRRDPLKRVLELGIGTGRHASVLADAGIEVHGLEISESMLVHLPNRPDIVGHLGDARSARLGQEFDAVFSFFHVASYQAEDNDISGFFSTARAHLAPGNPFVFDGWYSPGVMAQKPENRAVSAARDGIEITRNSRVSEDVDRSLVFVEQEFSVSSGPENVVETFTESHTMRHFTSSEVRLIAAQTGFAVVAVVDPVSGLAPTRESWAATYCLKAI